MPILEIEIVTKDANSNLPAGLTQSLADEAAQVFNAPAGTVWIKLRVIPSACYAEDGGKPDSVQPVFVSVLKSRVPEENALEDEISKLTRAIAAILNRPEANIHILYQANASGRAAFGGKLVQ